MTGRTGVLLLALVLLLAACGGDSSDTTASPTTQTAATSTTEAAAPESTTTAAPETTTSTTSTTVTPTTTTVAPQGAVLDDGRPATFLAITDDYEAVEVDTASGEIIHSYGQAGTAAEVDSAEEMPPNVFVGIWRLNDGSMVGISDCCEPAAGNIFYLEPDATLPDDVYSHENRTYGWMLSPSPTNASFANLGYELVIENGMTDSGSGWWVDDPSLGFPMGAAAWDRDGSQLYWVTRIEQAAALAMVDLAEGDPTHVTLLPWIGVHQWFDGVGSQAGGNLVGFLHTTELDTGEITDTTGIVFSTSGEILAEFPVETGSTWGGYDTTGTFLIYIDGDGAARWQGAGQAGVLGGGFISASW